MSDQKNFYMLTRPVGANLVLVRRGTDGAEQRDSVTSTRVHNGDQINVSILEGMPVFEVRKPEAALRTLTPGTPDPRCLHCEISPIVERFMQPPISKGLEQAVGELLMSIGDLVASFSDGYEDALARTEGLNEALKFEVAQALQRAGQEP